MDDHRKLYRRIFSIERFIRNLTRSFSTMCDSAAATGGTVNGGTGGCVGGGGMDMGVAVAAAAAAAAAHAAAAAEQGGTCGGGGSTAANVASASALLAKRERRLRLEKVGSYRVGRTLGRGNFAQVRVAYHEVANAKVAMKIVDKQSLDEENLAKIEREIRILQQLSHPFIVRLHEVIRTERYLYIVTEHVSNGELFDMLMDRGRQTEAESRRLFQQIVSAVAYCHAHGIVHRDLKAENLLLDKRGNIKIIDFGFSNYHQPGQLLSTWCGSPPYAAPELLLAQAYDGRQSDVWSLGVILYILVTAGFPFPGDSVDKLKRAVLSDHLKIPFWVSVECADLIRKMLTVQPAKRCTLHYVIQHKWMTCDMSEHIKQLLQPYTTTTTMPETTTTTAQHDIKSQLDPTVLIFMQQHTGWSDEQIVEEVLGRNYASPVFGTYELLLSRLSNIREAEAAAAAAVCISNGGAGGVPVGAVGAGCGGRVGAAGGAAGGGSTTNLQLDGEYTRRGSRGSIISGRANVEPTEQPQHATIPAHHLAKLSLLSTSPDYQETDDSDSASDWGMVPPASASAACDVPSSSSQFAASSSATAPQHQPSSYYKSTRQRRAYRRGVRAAATPSQQQAATTKMVPPPNARRLEQQQQDQRMTTYAATSLEQQYHQLNPLLNAAAQQFAVDTSRAVWANAAAAAALFASQLQQQHHSVSSDATRQQLQQAAALNLVSLQNFPFVDYAARMMHVPTQERRASANEALLGLNSYAHLLAACSTLGMAGGGTAAAPSSSPPNSASSAAEQQHNSTTTPRCSSSQGTLCTSSSSNSNNNSPRRQSLTAAAAAAAQCSSSATVTQQHHHSQRHHHHQHRRNNSRGGPAAASSYHAHQQPQQSRHSVEAEGECYLSGQRGVCKRNTVHSITGGLPLMSAAEQSPQLASAFQRHTRTPYAKQGGSSFGGAVMAAAASACNERRSSWAPPSSAGAAAAVGSTPLAINAQQHAQLERLYRQHIGGQQQQQPNAPSASGACSSADHAGGGGGVVVQQLQHEFQKLCSSTKAGGAAAAANAVSAAVNAGTSGTTATHNTITTAFCDGKIAAGGRASPSAAARQQQMAMQPRSAPTISITDEHNRQKSVLGGGVGGGVASFGQQQLMLSAILERQQQQSNQDNGDNDDDDMSVENHMQQLQFSQSLPHQRPATVCGFSTTSCSSAVQQPSAVGCPSSPIDNDGNASLSAAPMPPMKFVYIPVSIRTALERLQRVVDAHKLLCEVQHHSDNDESAVVNNMGSTAAAGSVNAIRIRLAPPGEHSSTALPPVTTTTILELVLHRMDQSPNISRASFIHVQGDTDAFEAIRGTLLRVFNEVL